MSKFLKSHKFSKILLLMSIFTPALGQTTDSQAAARTESPSDAKPSEHPVIDAAVEATKKTAEVIGNVAHRAREGIHAATKPASDPSKDSEEDDECGSEDEDDKTDNKSTKETLNEKGKDLKDKAGDIKDDAVANAKKGKRKVERAASDTKDNVKEGAEAAKEKAADIKDKITS
jgi:hypothetical protein